MSAYNIRPSNEKRFRTTVVENLIKQVLENECLNLKYSEDNAIEMTTKISNQLLDRLRELGCKNYKYVVHVIYAEQRGTGIQGSSKCYWDSDTDSCATHTFVSNDLCCVATVFGIYYY